MRPSKPRQVGELIAELLTRRNYGKVQTRQQLIEAWEAAVESPLVSQTRVGKIRQGTLEVTVSNSTLVQELSFRQREILLTMQEKLPNEKLEKIRFRVGPIE